MNENHEVTDETLMLRFQKGNQASFAILVQRYSRSMFNFTFRQVNNPSVAEDLVQDVFARIVQNAEQFRHESRFSTWAFTIARNVCTDHIRKMMHRRHTSLEEPLLANTEQSLIDVTADPRPANLADRAAITTQLRNSIQQAIDALPSDQREVFLLREIANIPFRDIAKMTGVSENTVKSRMRYALERLQQALSEYEDYAQTLG